MTLLERFEAATKAQMDKIEHLIGGTYQGGSSTWVLHSCNDKGILYFNKPGRKTLYTVGSLRIMTDLPRAKTQTLLLINAGRTYEWAELVRTDEETYSIPLYICKVVHGKHAGATIGAVAYYGKVHF